MSDELQYTQQITGWQKMFAWRPVYTIANEWVWLKRIYRRECIIDDLTVYEYATLVDIIKLNEKRRARERFWQSRNV